MKNIFDEVQRGNIYHGEVHLRKEKKRISPVIKETKPNHQVVPYYDGGLQLETYGESKLRGFRRAVVRKAPEVTRNIISVGKRTITPAIKDTFKEVGRVGLQIGKAQFDDLKRRKQKGMNVFW